MPTENEQLESFINSNKFCGACGQFMTTQDTDSQGFHSPDLCDANDEIEDREEIEMKSLFIECREWFDKVNGNSYFSARIWVNGGQVAILPFQYGYGDQFIYEAQKKLLGLGYLPQKNKNESIYTTAQKLGFDYYTAKAETKKADMFRVPTKYDEKEIILLNKEKI
jgi:hypothetical protein